MAWRDASGRVLATLSGERLRSQEHPMGNIDDLMIEYELEARNLHSLLEDHLWDFEKKQVTEIDLQAIVKTVQFIKSGAELLDLDQVESLAQKMEYLLNALCRRGFETDADILGSIVRASGLMVSLLSRTDDDDDRNGLDLVLDELDAVWKAAVSNQTAMEPDGDCQTKAQAPDGDGPTAFRSSKGNKAASTLPEAAQPDPANTPPLHISVQHHTANPAPSPQSPNGHIAQPPTKPQTGGLGRGHEHEAPLLALAPGMEMTGDEYLTFRLGRQNYGVSILQVQELIALPQITRLPRSQPHVLGVVNLRGMVVPILDLRIRLKLSLNQEHEPVVIVVRHEHKIIGAVVDSVDDVVILKDEQIQPPPDFAAAVEKEFIHGLANVDDQLLILLKINRLLARELLEDT